MNNGSLSKCKNIARQVVDDEKSLSSFDGDGGLCINRKVEIEHTSECFNKDIIYTIAQFSVPQTLLMLRQASTWSNEAVVDFITNDLRISYNADNIIVPFNDNLSDFIHGDLEVAVLYYAHALRNLDKPICMAFIKQFELHLNLAINSWIDNGCLIEEISDGYSFCVYDYVEEINKFSICSVYVLSKFFELIGDKSEISINKLKSEFKLNDFGIDLYSKVRAWAECDYSYEYLEPTEEYFGEFTFHSFNDSECIYELDESLFSLTKYLQQYFVSRRFVKDYYKDSNFLIKLKQLCGFIERNKSNEAVDQLFSGILYYFCQKFQGSTQEFVVYLSILEMFASHKLLNKAQALVLKDYCIECLLNTQLNLVNYHLACLLVMLRKMELVEFDSDELYCLNVCITSLVERFQFTDFSAQVDLLLQRYNRLCNI